MKPPGALTTAASSDCAGPDRSSFEPSHHSLAVVVEPPQPPVVDVQAVAPALVAVGDEPTPVALGQVDRRRDGEVPHVDQLEGAPALERRRARADRHRFAEHQRPLRALDELEVAALVQGIDLLGVGRRLPRRGQLRHLLRVLGGQVPELGRVRRQVVELPLGVVDRRHRHVAGDHLPAVPVEAPVADHLVDLLGPRRRVLGVGQRGRERRPGHRDERAAVALGRCLHPGQVQERGQQVDDVGVLTPQLAPGGQALGPGQDEGHRVAPGVGVDLVEPERACSKPWPSPGGSGAWSGARPADPSGGGRRRRRAGPGGGRSSRWSRPPHPPGRRRCRR